VLCPSHRSSINWFGSLSSCLWRSLDAEFFNARLESKEDLLEEELLVSQLLFLLVLEPACEFAGRDKVSSPERADQWRELSVPEESLLRSLARPSVGDTEW
jgi:hypothetical protein